MTGVFFPAMVDALADPVVRRRPAYVLTYWQLVQRLDFSERRRLRIEDVATVVSKHPRKVGLAIRWFIANGYLVRHKKLMDTFTYTLVEKRSGQATDSKSSPRMA
jgi:hypothetical protein